MHSPEMRPHEVHGASGQRHGARVPAEIARLAEPLDPELLAQPRHRLQHRREKMCVLVGIEMNRPETRGQYLFDLGFNRAYASMRPRATSLTSSGSVTG